MLYEPRRGHRRGPALTRPLTSPNSRLCDHESSGSATGSILSCVPVAFPFRPSSQTNRLRDANGRGLPESLLRLGLAPRQLTQRRRHMPYLSNGALFELPSVSPFTGVGPRRASNRSGPRQEQFAPALLW